MPSGTFVDGVVPQEAQPWVVSYSWSAHLHPDPGGGKIKEVSEALKRYGAEQDDLVFMDYPSLPQGAAMVPNAYKNLNGISSASDSRLQDWGFVQLPDRSEAEMRTFRSALPETTRLYAFKGGEG